ncbi:MAG TPA: hypothetical protein VH593_03540, partial [Ktedonobacteraceae bacterium]
VTDERQYELEKVLADAEAATGKKTAKWVKTRDKTRQDYIAALAGLPLPATIYAKRYIDTGTRDYDEQEVMAAAEALNIYRAANSISADDYSVTIIIDGLSKTMSFRLGSEFRKLGVKTRKVTGNRDEASAVLRLCDAIAGLVREAHEGREAYKTLESRLERAGKLYEL